MHCAKPEQLQRDALRGRNMAAEAQTVTAPHWTKICSWNRLREQSPDWFGSEPLSLTRLCQVVDSGRLFSNRNCSGPGRRTSCSQNRLESSVSSCCCLVSINVCLCFCKSNVAPSPCPGPLVAQLVEQVLHVQRLRPRCRSGLILQLSDEGAKAKNQTSNNKNIHVSSGQRANSKLPQSLYVYTSWCCTHWWTWKSWKHREKLHFKKLSCLCGQARGSSGAARLSRTVSVGICGETNHLAGFTLLILNELWSVCCGAAGFWRRLFQCYFFFLLYCSVRFAASVFFQYCSNPRWVNRTSTHTVRTYCCSSLLCKEVIVFG